MIVANEGKILTNGILYGDVIYLADGMSESEFHEIDKTTFEELAAFKADNFDYTLYDAIQQNGERKDYSYAFCNSGYEYIIPKYPIKADNIMYMFMGCDKLKTAENVKIEVLSGNPQMMYVFSNCLQMKKAPRIIIRASIVKTYISMYAGCQNLESVNVYWGDGTTDAVTQRNSCQNMFFKCGKLKDINFGAAETGSPLNLDLSYSAELTEQSIISLLNSLKTIPEGAAGKYEITIATQTAERLSEEIKNGFTSKGWALLSKDNQPKESEV